MEAWRVKHRHKASRIGLTALLAQGSANICDCGAYRIREGSRAVGRWIAATPEAHLLPARTAPRELTRDDVTVRLIVTQETDVPVRGNALASGNDDEDRAAEEKQDKIRTLTGQVYVLKRALSTSGDAIQALGSTVKEMTDL